MPRYYFDVRNGSRLIKDPAAAEFANVEEATKAALRLAHELVSMPVPHNPDVHRQIFEIRDHGGKLVATVPFRDAIEYQ
jgi:hypothetical protein